MQPDETIEVRVLFHGHVQGVCFRAYAQQYANERGLTGTVQNLPDGAVEMVVQGTEKQIDQLIARLSGPSGPGHITHIDTTTRPSTHPFLSFDIRY